MRITPLLSVLSAVVLSALPAIARAQVPDSNPTSADQAVGLMHHQLALAGLMRDRCSQAFPSDRQQYESAMRAWVSENAREIGVAERMFVLAIAAMPDIRAQIAEGVRNKAERILLAVHDDGDERGVARMHGNCQRFFRALASEESRQKLASVRRFLPRSGSLRPARTTRPRQPIGRPGS